MNGWLNEDDVSFKSSIIIIVMDGRKEVRQGLKLRVFASLMLQEKSAVALYPSIHRNSYVIVEQKGDNSIQSACS